MDLLTIRASLSQLEDHELVGRLRSGALTDEARHIAADILQSRGIEPHSPPPEAHPEPEVARSGSTLRRMIIGFVVLISAGLILRVVGVLFGVP